MDGAGADARQARSHFIMFTAEKIFIMNHVNKILR